MPRSLTLAWTLGLALSGPAWAQTQPTAGRPLDPAEVRSWREDLAYLARQLPQRHRNLYHTTPKPVLDSALNALDRRLPALARHQVILELARIIALVGDGHTNLAPTRDSAIGFRTYPVKLYMFTDGLFVRAARADRADLVGARVLRVGRASSDEAYAKVRELIGRDNEMGARFFAPFLLAMPEVLHGLGMIDDMERAELLVEQHGRRRTVRLEPDGPARLMPPDTDVSWETEPGWVDLRDGAEAPVPPWLGGDLGRPFRVERLVGGRAVYVRLNQVGDEEGETLEAFSRRLLALLDSTAADKLVLDLRLNRGGNGELNPPLVRRLVQARRLDGPGRLFVLIGRGTFSAAQFLVHDLERYTDAVFVGEPTSGKPNAYGDSRKIILPRSGITVRASVFWWQGHPLDDRPWKAPDVAAGLSSSDYRANRDPVLAAALEYRAAPPGGTPMPTPSGR